MIFQLHILVAEEFIRDVMAYGSEIQVISPESLRSTLKERAQLLLSNYAD